MEDNKIPYLLRNTFISNYKPSWIFHPIKRYRYNKWIRNLTIISDLLENYEYLKDLALLTDYDPEGFEYALIFSRDGSGDYIKHRTTYIITYESDFDNICNLIRFKDIVFNHHGEL